MACLFCLQNIPIEKGLNESPSPPVTSVDGDEAFLKKTNVGNPTNNIEAFNCLCRLLNVNWRKSSEEETDNNGENSEDREIRDEENMTFDTRHPLPLCSKCENIYQEVYQLYQKILELEVTIMKKVKVIRQTIDTTENGELRELIDPKLNQFRRMVLQSTINNQSLLETIPNQPMFLSQEDYLAVKQEVLENDQGDYEEEADFPEHFQPIVKLEENLGESEYQLAEEEVHSSSSLNTRSSNRLLIIKTFQNKSDTDSTIKNTKRSEKQKQFKSTTAGSKRTSPKNNSTATTPTAIPAGRNVKTKLKQVTESTPKIHIDCFTCCYCGLRFNHTGTLSKHKRRHEPKKLKCPLCPKMFTFDSDVDRHVKRVHKAK